MLTTSSTFSRMARRASVVLRSSSASQRYCSSSRTTSAAVAAAKPAQSTTRLRARVVRHGARGSAAIAGTGSLRSCSVRPVPLPARRAFARTIAPPHDPGAALLQFRHNWDSSSRPLATVTRARRDLPSHQAGPRARHAAADREETGLEGGQADDPSNQLDRDRGVLRPRRLRGRRREGALHGAHGRLRQGDVREALARGLARDRDRQEREGHWSRSRPSSRTAPPWRPASSPATPCWRSTASS